MKLLLGHRGKKKGWTTVDMVDADMIWDLNKPLELYNEVDEIAGMHIMEHLKPATIVDVVSSWHKALVKEGTIIIEVPDIDGVFREYLDATSNNRRTLLMEYVYGNSLDEYNHHYWGWSRNELLKLFHLAGFESVIVVDGKDYHSTEAPCIRIEAIK